MIRACSYRDFATVLAVINEAAEAYRGVIPEDVWHEPYMSAEELRREIDAGVRFFGYEDGDGLVGVMGIQDVGDDVTLIRHAYVRTSAQRGGIGTQLLAHLTALTDRPVLIGTWADADWAVRFYEKNGFRLLTPEEKTARLRSYWDIPDRQVETSVVLTDGKSLPFR